MEDGIFGIEVRDAITSVGDEGIVGGGLSKTTESSSLESASSSPSRVTKKEDGEYTSNKDPAYSGSRPCINGGQK